MTYLDDTEENAGGQTTLMYRLYQNGAWSDGKPVDKTGRLDTAAQMFSLNGFTYVMYETVMWQLRKICPRRKSCST